MKTELRPITPEEEKLMETLRRALEEKLTKEPKPTDQTLKKEYGDDDNWQGRRARR